ncbi:MAG: DUF3592 domain-containing protein [Bacteroidia bacterium]
MQWVILIFCLVIGSCSFYFGIKLWRLYKSVRRWPKVNAKVLSKAVVPRRLASGSRASRTINITYEYLFEGQVYKNNTVFIAELLKGEKGFMPDAAQKFLDKIGDTAEVLVDPESPDRSVMYSDGAVMYMLMITGGIAIVLGGLLSML